MATMGFVGVAVVTMTVVALALVAARLMLQAQRMTATRSFRELPALMQDDRRTPAQSEELCSF